MIRSNFAITRLIILPYALLLCLYFAVVGGGGTWLYYQFRGVETRLLLDELMRAIDPLAQRLRSGNALAAMRDSEAWLVTDVERLFVNLPALRYISVRGPESGFRMESGVPGTVHSQAALPLPEGVPLAEDEATAGERLHNDDGPEFVISFSLRERESPAVRLDFAFDRAMLLTRISEGMSAIKRSILLFGIAGAVSIVIALGITAVAMRTTRKLESYFQEIYQRASLTETAARLVHDLRNPLAALRANAKALLVAPEQTPEIVEAMDRDIVVLNDKLSAFLNLTRRREEPQTSVDVGSLIDDAVRLAEPVVAQQGLAIQTLIAPDLPRPTWQATSVRDALLNLILNAAQSGQREGSICITAQAKAGVLEIAVEDRGRGISKDEMPHLFEAFYTTRADGNGLGLAIVRRIAANHQGRVDVENRPGGGARFVLALPLQRKEKPQWWSKFKRHFPT